MEEAGLWIETDLIVSHYRTRPLVLDQVESIKNERIACGCTIKPSCVAIAFGYDFTRKDQLLTDLAKMNVVDGDTGGKKFLFILGGNHNHISNVLALKKLQDTNDGSEPIRKKIESLKTLSVTVLMDMPEEILAAERADICRAVSTVRVLVVELLTLNSTCKFFF